MTAVEWARNLESGPVRMPDLIELERVALASAPAVRDEIDGIRGRFAEAAARIEERHDGRAIVARFGGRPDPALTAAGAIASTVIPFLVLLGAAIAAAVLILGDDPVGNLTFGGVVMLITAALCLLGLIAGRRDPVGPPAGWSIGAALVSAIAAGRSFLVSSAVPSGSDPSWRIAVVLGTLVVIASAVVHAVRRALTRRARNSELASVPPEAEAYLDELRAAFAQSTAAARLATAALPAAEVAVMVRDRNAAFDDLRDRSILDPDLPRDPHPLPLGELQLGAVLIPLLGGSPSFSLG
jgi:hypothetical protein